MDIETTGIVLLFAAFSSADGFGFDCADGFGFGFGCTREAPLPDGSVGSVGDFVEVCDGRVKGFTSSPVGISFTSCGVGLFTPLYRPCGLAPPFLAFSSAAFFSSVIAIFVFFRVVDESDFCCASLFAFVSINLFLSYRSWISLVNGDSDTGALSDVSLISLFSIVISDFFCTVAFPVSSTVLI